MNPKINTKILSVLICSMVVLSMVMVANTIAPTQAQTENWLSGYDYRTTYTNTSTLPARTILDISADHYSMSFTGIEEATPQITNQKVAIVDGVRYLFTSGGFNGGSATSTVISAFKCNERWEPIEFLANTTGTYGDFYTSTVPESTLSDYILVFGSRTSSFLGFIGYFDTTSNTFGTFTDAGTYASYITYVNYCTQQNLFEITCVSSTGEGSFLGKIATSTAANLFTPANWVAKADISSIVGNNEHRDVYFTKDALIFFSVKDTTTGYGKIVTVNPTTGATNTVYTTNYQLTSADATSATYISSDSYYVYVAFCTADGYYKIVRGTKDGFTQIYSASEVGYGGSYEKHGHVVPVTENTILFGNLNDANSNGYWALLNTSTTTATEIERYTGVAVHYTDNRATFDGSNIVLGAEATYSGGQTYVYLLTSGFKGQLKDAQASDLRVTKKDDTTALTFRVFSYDSTTHMYRIVIDTSTATNGFNLYWGNPAATSLSSASLSPYLLFDDFNDATLDTAKWDKLLNGFATEADGTLTLVSSGSATDGRGSISSKQRFDCTKVPFTVQMSMKLTEPEVLNFYTSWDRQFDSTYNEGIRAEGMYMYNFPSTDDVVITSVFTNNANAKRLLSNTNIAAQNIGSTFNTLIIRNDGHYIDGSVGTQSLKGALDKEATTYATNNGYIGIVGRDSSSGCIILDEIQVYMTPNTNAVGTFQVYTESPTTHAITFSSNMYGTSITIQDTTQSTSRTLNSGGTQNFTVTDGDSVTIIGSTLTGYTLSYLAVGATHHNSPFTIVSVTTDILVEAFYTESNSSPTPTVTPTETNYTITLTSNIFGTIGGMIQDLTTKNNATLANAIATLIVNDDDTAKFTAGTKSGYKLLYIGYRGSHYSNPLTLYHIHGNLTVEAVYAPIDASTSPVPTNGGSATDGLNSNMPLIAMAIIIAVLIVIAVLLVSKFAQITDQLKRIA